MMLYGGGREGFLIMIKSQKKREMELHKAAKPRLRPCNAGAAQTKKGGGAAKTRKGKGGGAAQTKKGGGGAGRRSSGGGRRGTSTPAGNAKGGGEGKTPQKGGGRSAGRGGGGSGPPPPPPPQHPPPPPPPPPLPNPRWLLLCLQHVVNVRREKGQNIDPMVMRVQYGLNIENPCTIHGLWPPSPAEVEDFNYVPFNQVLVAEILNQLKSDWPNVKDPVSFVTSLIFWAEQWRKHGRYCNMDLLTYMSKALNWFEMLKRVLKDSLSASTKKTVLDLVQFENQIMENGFGKPLVHTWMYDKKICGKHVRRQFLKEIRFYSIFTDVAEVAYTDFINPPMGETTNYRKHSMTML